MLILKLQVAAVEAHPGEEGLAQAAANRGGRQGRELLQGLLGGGQGGSVAEALGHVGCCSPVTQEQQGWLPLLGKLERQSRRGALPALGRRQAPALLTRLAGVLRAIAVDSLGPDSLPQFHRSFTNLQLLGAQPRGN